MKTSIHTFVQALFDRMDAFTLLSTAMDCIPRHLLRFTGNDSIHIYPYKTNQVVSVCEIFSDEGVVEYMGVTEQNGCICVVRGKVEELPDECIEVLMRVVLERSFNVPMHDISSVSPSLAAWRIVVTHFTQDLPDLVELDVAVRSYPDKVVGAWASDYDTQNYIEDCRNADIEEDE